MITADELNSLFHHRLPGLIGMKITQVEPRRLKATLALRSELLAPNGYLHGATVVALANTACGCGAIAHMPAGAKGFTTIELKCNFLGTAREGSIACDASLEHEGRKTQVWDAVVKDSQGRAIALFRCTQMILW
ncbi:MAG: PaaI family thioesterase [Burkholderiales bacterium]